MIKSLLESSFVNQRQNKVYIGGEVIYPGNYIISKIDEKVSDIIDRAGGITQFGYPPASRLIRNNEVVRLSFEKIIKYPRTKYNFIVQDLDSIVISSKPNLVQIVGPVNSPGNYQFIPNQRVDDYIKIAGGYNSNAARNYTYIEFPDGTSSDVKLFLPDPIVLDGSIIYGSRKRTNRTV